MLKYICDGCGKDLHEKELRYTVTIDVRAAYDEMEVHLADLVRDHRKELIRLIDQLKDRDPNELEEQVYKLISLDLCPSCQKAFISDPLHFHPEQGEIDGEVDIDGFLRSLGFGETKEAE